MRETSLTVRTQDEISLAGTLFEPDKPPVAAVVVNGATGVAQHYYKAFASHLASSGFATLTYDYRGIAKSVVPPDLSHVLTMRAWGEQDTTAAIDLLDHEYPQLPIFLVGHSVGGQLLGLAHNNQRITAAYCIGSQSGYWRLWPLSMQPVRAWFWFFAVPLCLVVYGKVPRQLAGYELPKGVAAEWKRWCTHPDFIVDKRGRPIRDGFQRYRAPLRMVHIADDHRFAPRACVDALASFFTGTTPEVDTLEPAELGCSEIGHFGFFRRSMPHGAWDQVADWLLSAASRNDSTTAQRVGVLR